MCARRWRDRLLLSAWSELLGIAALRIPLAIDRSKKARVKFRGTFRQTHNFGCAFKITPHPTSARRQSRRRGYVIEREAQFVMGEELASFDDQAVNGDPFGR